MVDPPVAPIIDPATNRQDAIQSANEDAYDDLLVAIENNVGKLSLLIAVCDDPVLREDIITRYETELVSEFLTRRLTLAQGEPSINAAATQAIENDPTLQTTEKAVLTVTGIEKLRFLALDDERSEQDVFFGYLQWTREALRRIPFPIVIWVTSQILKNLSRKSPDFWSWRKGVFRFTSLKTTLVPLRVMGGEVSPLHGLDLPDEDDTLLPLDDLKALVEQTEARNPHDPLLANLYYQMGRVYAARCEEGKTADYQPEQHQAMAYLKKAIALQEQLNQTDDLTRSKEVLSRLYWLQGRYSEAESLCLQILDTKRRLGEGHPDVATWLNNLALLCSDQGRTSEAEPLFLQAIDIGKRNLEEDHLAVVTRLNNLANLYYAQGRTSEAEPLFLQAIDIGKRSLGEDHPAVATSLNNLANLYYAQGQTSEAEPFLLQAIDIGKRSLGEDHPAVATSLNNLANLYYAQGHTSEAELLFLQALEITKRSLGEEHPAVATRLNNLALLYYAQGRTSEAESLFLQALEITKRSLGEEHPDVATSLNNLALLCSDQGRTSEAESLFLQAIDIGKCSLGEEHPAVATRLNNLANLYYAQGHAREAEPLFLQAIDIGKRSVGEEHPAVATRLNNLANLYYAQGRTREAELLFLQALEITKFSRGEEHPDVATSLNNLAALYKEQGHYSEAASLLQEALGIREKVFGYHHAATERVRERLREVYAHGQNPTIWQRVRQWLRRG